MRRMDFKMEREGLVREGDAVTITEGVLPSSWYYVVEPAVAMSANYPFRERLRSREGIVKEIKRTPQGFYAARSRASVKIGSPKRIVTSAGRIQGAWFSNRLSVPVMATGTMGQPDFSAIFMPPSLKGSISSP